MDDSAGQATTKRYNIFVYLRNVLKMHAIEMPNTLEKERGERESNRFLYDFTHDYTECLVYKTILLFLIHIPIFAVIGFCFHQRFARTAVQAQIRWTLRCAIAWICGGIELSECLVRNQRLGDLPILRDAFRS